MLALSPFLSEMSCGAFFFGYYGLSITNSFPQPLNSKEEFELFEQFKNGNSEARNILIERNLSLVAHIAKQYTGPNIEQEDIISIGTIGLIKGINSYKGDKGVKLATYVARCIENEILMHLRSTKKLSQEISLNDALGQDKEGNEITFIDVIENSEVSVEDQIDLKMKVKRLYQKISEVLQDREKMIIELRFGLNGKEAKTQNEIAKMLGISRSYVSRIETKAINKLSQEFEKWQIIFKG